MPVLRIHALCPEKLDRPTLFQHCSERIAEALGCPPAQCWVLLIDLRNGDYLEGGVLRSRGTPHSPVAVLSAYHGRKPDEIAAALRGVAGAITEAFSLAPGDVFVEFHEIHPGHVFTGGEVR